MLHDLQQPARSRVVLSKIVESSTTDAASLERKKRERQHFARVLTFGPRGSIFRFRNAGGLPRRMSSALGRYLRRDPNGSSRLLTG